MKEKITKAVPALVFIVLLISPFFAWRVTSDLAEQESRNRFYQDSLNIQSLIQVKLKLYILGAEGLAGFVEESDNVRRDEWSAYIKKVNLVKDYPGISSVSYIEKVENKNKLAFVESVRKDTSLNPKGYPDFNIYPEGDKKEYFVVKYIEPLAGREKGLGFDVSSEAKRLLALEIARDSGKASSTGKITLATTNAPGFSFLIPVYNNAVVSSSAYKNSTDLNSPNERKANIKGFAYPVFRGDAIFKAAYGEVDLFPGVDFEIYESENLSRDSLLYDRDPSYKISQTQTKPGLYTKEALSVDSQSWVILIAAKEGSGLTKSQAYLPVIVLISGLVFSFILLGTYLYIQKRNRTPSSPE